MNKDIIKNSINKIKNKDSKFLFFVIDTQGTPLASMANIYDHALGLIELGYSAYIVTESEKYKGEEWLGEKYTSVPVINIRKEELKISASDFLIVPEVMGSIITNSGSMPCKKIVMLQNYDYALDVLQLDNRWSFNGYDDIIVTNQEMANFVKETFHTSKAHIVPIAISEDFKDRDVLKQPIVHIYSKNPSDAERFTKLFYLRNPQYQWVSFKLVGNMSRENLATDLSKSCALVYMDSSTSFGTLPLEATRLKTNVIMFKTELEPEYSQYENIHWVENQFMAVDYLQYYLDNWLICSEEFEQYEDIDDKYTKEKQLDVIKEVYETIVDERVIELEKIIKVKDEE